jgi:hypothetical protein
MALTCYPAARALSILTAERIVADRLGAKVRKEVGDEMEPLSGLRSFDAVSLGDALRAEARQAATAARPS